MSIKRYSMLLALTSLLALMLVACARPAATSGDPAPPTPNHSAPTARPLPATTVPTVAPTTAPSTVPTLAPTAMPTLAPTTTPSAPLALVSDTGLAIGTITIIPSEPNNTPKGDPNAFIVRARATLTLTADGVQNARRVVFFADRPDELGHDIGMATDLALGRAVVTWQVPWDAETLHVYAQANDDAGEYVTTPVVDIFVGHGDGGQTNDAPTIGKLMINPAIPNPDGSGWTVVPNADVTLTVDGLQGIDRVTIYVAGGPIAEKQALGSAKVSANGTVTIPWKVGGKPSLHIQIWAEASDANGMVVDQTRVYQLTTAS